MNPHHHHHPPHLRPSNTFLPRLLHHLHPQFTIHLLRRSITLHHHHHHHRRLHHLYPHHHHLYTKAHCHQSMEFRTLPLHLHPSIDSFEKFSTSNLTSTQP
uniref:Uncharacterized protein n=1 Tax=Cucumis melo TaxID=3656 RepID=A0A9I9CJI8_CUCME